MPPPWRPGQRIETDFGDLVVISVDREPTGRWIYYVELQREDGRVERKRFRWDGVDLDELNERGNE